MTSTLNSNSGIKPQIESSIMHLCITEKAVEDVSLETRKLLNTPLIDDGFLKNKVDFLLNL